MPGRICRERYRAIVSVAVLSSVPAIQGCSVLFDYAANAPEDAGPDTDGDLASPDAAVGCPILSCTPDTVARYSFSSSEPLAGSCGGPDLTSTGTASTAPSISNSVGEALRLQPEQVLSAAPQVDGSWTIDFWLYPEIMSGDLLQYKRIDVPNGPCGLDLTMEAGALRLYWDTGIGRTLKGTPQLELSSWHHITVVYVQTGGSAVFRYFVDGEAGEESSINQCAGESSALVLVDSDPGTVQGGIEGFIDEVRLRNISVTTPSCSPPFSF